MWNTELLEALGDCPFREQILPGTFEYTQLSDRSPA